MTTATVEVEGNMGKHTFKINPNMSSVEKAVVDEKNRISTWTTQFGTVEAYHDPDYQGDLHVIFDDTDHVVPMEEELTLENAKKTLSIFVRHNKPDPRPEPGNC
jgi:hypothetical protein